jgi:hypothetical protein
MVSVVIDAHMKHSAWVLLATIALAPAFAYAGNGNAMAAAAEKERREERHDDRREDRRDTRYDRRDDRRDYRVDHRRDVRHDSRGYVLDARYGHNHYYPPRGYAVGVLPRGYVTVRYGRSPYYYHHGIWYRPGHSGFVVVRPAIGLYVPVLPPFYSTVWYRGVPYYYADDVYYRYRTDRREYEVSDPPPESETSTTQPAGSQADLFIYPKNGQSEEQQGKDRYECHSWAASQSGFDPTQPMGGVDDSQAAAKRADYQRAQTACLEARGYSVK